MEPLDIAEREDRNNNNLGAMFYIYNHDEVSDDDDDDYDDRRRPYNLPEDTARRRMVNQMWSSKFDDLDLYFKQRHLNNVSEEVVKAILENSTIEDEELSKVITERATRAFVVHWKLYDNLLSTRKVWDIHEWQIITYPAGSPMNCLREKAIIDCENYKNEEKTKESINYYLFHDDDYMMDPDYYLEEYSYWMGEFGIKP